MQSILQSKKTLVVILVILGGFALYQFVLKKDDAASGEFLLQESFNPADVIIGRDLLSLLAKMRNTDLDTSVFDDPAWKKLVDFGEPIPEQPIERPNPFAPIGTDAAGSASSSATPNGTSNDTDDESEFPFIP